MTNKDFTDFKKKLTDADLIEKIARIEFAKDLRRCMLATKIGPKELSQKSKVPLREILALLNGQGAGHLLTIAKVSIALNGKATVRLIDKKDIKIAIGA